jgi:ParB-like chromosome segregation protein Spo0J
MEDIVNLVPHPQNPNKHPDKQIALLSKVIRHTGWRSPIIVSKKTGFIVSGHGRLEAAKLLNITQVPIDEQDFANEADEYAHLLADNRITELSNLDIPEVNDIVNKLKKTDYDLELAAIDKDYLDFLMPDLTTISDKDIDEDELSKSNNECPSCGFAW